MPIFEKKFSPKNITFSALGEQGKHAVVNEIVDEDNSDFGAANQVRNI